MEALDNRLFSFNKRPVNPLFLDYAVSYTQKKGGGKLSTTVSNKDGYAFGLIQFTQIAANEIGVPLETIKKAGIAEQFKYATQYLEKQAGRRGVQLSDLKIDDLYLLILYPKAVGSSREGSAIVISDNAGRSYTNNTSIDKEDGNNDGKITRSDVRGKLDEWADRTSAAFGSEIKLDY